MNPKDLKYAKTHEWVRAEGDTLLVGLTRFAVDQLTDVTYIELPKVGAKVKAGEGMGEIESVKAVSDIYAPVSGEVVAVNGALAADASLVSRDPYGVFVPMPSGRSITLWQPRTIQNRPKANDKGQNFAEIIGYL